MNSTTGLRTTHDLDMLARLRQALADFAQREEKLVRDLHTRRNTILRQQREAAQVIDTRLEAMLKQASEAFDAREATLKSTYASRRARIQRVQQTGIREVMQKAQQAKQKWMGDLQMRHFQAERSLPENLKAEDAAYSRFTTHLGTQSQRMAAVEAQAKAAFSAFPSFARAMRAQAAAAPEGTRDELFTKAEALLDAATEQLNAFSQLPLAKLFRILPIPLLVIIAIAAGVVIALAVGLQSGGIVAGSVAGVVLIGATFGLQAAGAGQGRGIASQAAATFAEASQVHAAAAHAAKEQHSEGRKRVKAEYARVCEELQEGWNHADEVEVAYSRERKTKIERNVPRATARNERLFRQRLPRIAEEKAAALAGIRADADQRKGSLGSEQDKATAALKEEEETRRAEITEAWKNEVEPYFAEMARMKDTAAALFPAWTSEYVETWAPAKTFCGGAKYGTLELDLAKPGTPAPKQLALPGSTKIELPLALSFPSEGSLLFETQDSGNASIVGSLNQVVLRLLATTPPGKIAFTIIDPVSLGQNFAGLMHLADYEEAVINRRIWTQRDQIEERLSDLNEHIEKVIQMYLRNEYSTIIEYNEQAGSVAEKLQFIVVADFPANFSDVAAKRLQSIATSGPRCGVYTLIHWDSRHPMPDGFVPDELRKHSVAIRGDHAGLALKDSRQGNASLSLDAPPSAELAAALVHKIGKASVDSNRVEVPFTQVAPRPEDYWKSETTSELRVAIGRTGATKLQYLAIGKGTRQHALFAGKTGSGKSTLFHVIITNLALTCSPEQVEFYLIDFKKGVEFKCYAEHRLPHARVVAIESDREFGLSVLQRVDEELKRRGDLFRKLGAQDIAGYKRAGGTEPMPRALLIIDEFQEFFTEDDEIAQNASVLFDRIVRQGRAFGIHVLLGSQTLGGAFTLARATMGQMVIRVALQCNEADAYLIMDDTNAAPRLLSRPGEGIYNDAAGAIEGNSPFQVVWISDAERDQWLEKVQGLAQARGDRPASPIVFEGNAPADIRENDALALVLDTRPAARPISARCWLGAPNSIKGPTEAVFHRQSGNHLLIVGQRDDAAMTMLGVSLVALAAQHPAGTARFILLHNAVPGSSDAAFFDRIVAAIPHEVTVAQANDVASAMSKVGAELKERSSGEAPADAPNVFVLVHGVQRFKKLRQEDEFSFSSSGDEGGSPGAQFNDLICEGSAYGLHLIATVDTFNNVGRFLSRKALSEIEMRVAFQMSANDSASLIDAPKASGLGLHRALLYNEQQGTLETFRPYAAPDAGWIDEAAAKLAAIKAG